MRAHLRLCNDKGAEAMVADGPRHGEHSHHTYAVPKQDLTASRLHPRLGMVSDDVVREDIVMPMVMATGCEIQGGLIAQ